MQTSRAALLLTCLCLLLPRTCRAQDEASSQPTVRMQFNCGTLIFSTDAVPIPMMEADSHELWYNDEFRNKLRDIVGNVCNIDTETLTFYVSVERYNVLERHWKLMAEARAPKDVMERVIASSDDWKDQVAIATAARLEQVFEEFAQEKRANESVQWEARINTYRHERDQLTTQVQRCIDELIDFQASGESASELKEQLSALRTELRQSRLESLKCEASRKAIDAQIDRLKLAQQESAVDTDITEELKRVIDAEQAAIEAKLKAQHDAEQAAKVALDAAREELAKARTLQEQAVVSKQQLATIEERVAVTEYQLQAAKMQAEAQRQEGEKRLAEAKISLLKSRQNAEVSGQKGELGELNRQLTQIAIEIDELLGTRDALQDMIAELEDELRAQLRQQISFDDLQRTLDLHRARLRDLEQDLQQAEAALAGLSSGDYTVRVRGLDEQEPAPVEDAKPIEQ